MGGLLNKKCTNCGDVIYDAGIFSSNIRCRECARIYRSGYKCGCCSAAVWLKYDCNVDFILCDSCSGNVRSYIDTGNYHGLKLMVDAITFNGYKVPQHYTDELNRAWRRRMIGQ